MLLNDRVCVITGAASARGLGKATARLFADHGARVAILDLDAGRPRRPPANRARPCRPRLRRHRQGGLPAAAAALVARLGRIDVLVNNAGITQPLKFLDIAPENYDAVIDVNLRGTLYLSQASIPAHARRSARARSCACRRSRPSAAAASSAARIIQRAKAGVLGLAKAMAREFGPDGIRVNSVTPGLIQTDITGGKLTDEMRAEILKGIPLDRLGDAEDVAGACLFLASDLSSYITGAAIDVNGGMLIH